MTQTQSATPYRATGTPRRLTHHNYFVGDINKTMDFYNQVLGIEETFRLENRPGGFMSNGNTHHDLGFVEVGEHTQDRGKRAQEKGIMEVPLEWGTKPGLNHFAYEMYNEAELVAAYERLTELGVTPWLLEDRLVTRSVYFSDPEGNGLEYTVDMLRNWRDYRKPGAKVFHQEYVPGQEEPKTESFITFDPEIRRVPDAALHAKRASHAVIVAADFVRLRHFYIDVVGLRELFHSPTGEFSVLHGKDYPSYSMALVAAVPGREPGVHRIAFELADDSGFDGAEEALAAKGVDVEFKVEHPKKRAVYFRDPDNNLVQCYHEAPDFLDALPSMDPALALMLL